MKILIITCLAILAFGIIVYIKCRPSRSRSIINQPQSESVEDLSKWGYEQAVIDASENYKIYLDGSEESIKQVEGILDIIERSGKDPAGNLKVGVRGTAMLYGFYIGEIIRVKHNGVWGTDSDVAGPKSYPIKYNNATSFPTAWTVKRVLNGSEDNVWNKYCYFISGEKGKIVGDISIEKNIKDSAQQVDSAEASTNAVPPSAPSGSPR